jgi:hypothetical protein
MAKLKAEEKNLPEWYFLLLAVSKPYVLCPAFNINIRKYGNICNGAFSKGAFCNWVVCVLNGLK